MSLSNDSDVVDEGDKCDVHSTQQFGPGDALVHGRRAQKERTNFEPRNKSLDFCLIFIFFAAHSP